MQLVGRLFWVGIGILASFLLACGGSTDEATDGSAGDGLDSLVDGKPRWLVEQPGLGSEDGQQMVYIYGKGNSAEDALNKACLEKAKQVAIEMKDMLGGHQMPQLDSTKYMVQEYYDPQGTKKWLRISKVLMGNFKKAFRVLRSGEENGVLCIQAGLAYDVYASMKEEYYGPIPHVSAEERDALDKLDNHIGDAQPE